MHIAIHEALADLKQSDKLFLELFTHGTLCVEIYNPKGIDNQQPHHKDEVYIVIAGSGEFLNGETTISFKKGDLLFVTAGTIHRFLNFTDDLVTWVIFYGPHGGEANNNSII